MKLTRASFRRSFGHLAEDVIKEALKEIGIEVLDSTDYEDIHMKVDFWVVDPDSDQLLPIQFTTSSLRSEKARQARELGVVFVWVNPNLLKDWVNRRTDGVLQRIVTSFWQQAHQEMSLIGDNLLPRNTSRRNYARIRAQRASRNPFLPRLEASVVITPEREEAGLKYMQENPRG